MATNRNRRGSVLLMAIGMLSIIAIMASTFLIVSNLDVMETQTLSVKAQADPVAQGVLASVMSAIAADRHATSITNQVPYSATTAVLPDYMDYGDDTLNRGLDRWLAREYDWREKIGLQLSHVDTVDDAGYLLGSDATPNFSQFAAVTSDGTASANGFNYVCTDGDKIPDARLFDTKVVCPGTGSQPDADYYAAVRVVDMGGRISLGTAGGGATGTNPPYKPPPASPAMIDLNSYIGSVFFQAIHNGMGGFVGRCGSLASNPYNSMRTYDRYGGQQLLGPLRNPTDGSLKPGYSPFTVGDEMFLMMCDAYVAPVLPATTNPKYTGRVYDLLRSGGTIKSLHATDEGYAYGIGEPTDEVRRHLTTCSSVSACVRHPKITTAETDLTLKDEFQWLRPITSAADCLSVHKRMYRMLTELNIGKAAGTETIATVRRKMAASFAANLLAYQANGAIGAPWAFTPPADGGPAFTVYGAKQDLVITQVYAKHRKTTSDKEAERNWAFGYAVEIANPTPYPVDLTQYKLVYNGVDANAIALTGTLAAPGLGATTPPKKVIYTFDSGPAALDINKPGTFIGGVSDAVVNSTWTPDPSKFAWFSKGATSYVELRHVFPTETVTIDRVSSDPKELNYSITNSSAIKVTTGTADASADIRRDDRLLGTPATKKMAMFNLALYKQVTPAAHTLGAVCGVNDGEIKQDTVGVGYSAPLYRPRDKMVAAGDPNTTNDPNMLDAYRMTSLGELANVYLAGPISDPAVTTSPRLGFPQRIIRNDTSNIFSDLGTRGRLPIRPAGITATTALLANSYEGTPWTGTLPYPDVPAGAVFGEFFTRLYEHAARPNEAPRIYGQINVNTAPKDVLMRLPWPVETNNKLGLSARRNLPDYKREDAVDYILAYRDKRILGRALSPFVPYPDYTTGRTGISTYVTSAITANRLASNYRGFLTPGEVAIPLGDYMEYLLTTKDSVGTADNVRKDADFAQVRNGLFTAVADCLTTRSDVFGVYIHVQHDSTVPARYKWRYMAIVDRSCVLTGKDVPALLMFTEVK